MSRQGEAPGTATYCHCYPVFRCEPAMFEIRGEHGVWHPLCERCMEIAWRAGLSVRKLQQPREVES